MIKTIKLPYKSNYNFDRILKQYSNVVRWSFNRFKENKSQKEIRLLSKSLSNIELLNSWFIQCAILEGQSIYSKNLDNKVIFGSKKQFYRRIRNFISNNDLKLSRLVPLSIQGEMYQSGNRSFNLDIIDNNRIIFKLNRTEHIPLELPNIRNNYLKDLIKLQHLNDVRQKQIGYTYSIKLDREFIYISFDEFKKESINLVNTRYIGIDLNPNEIGISIKDNDKILEVRRYILNIENNNHDKVKHEVFEISKKIFNLFKSYNCKFIFVEDLTIKSNNHNKGTKFNRNINNKWIRNDFIINLEKRIKSIDGYLYKVNSVYTSFIGNLIYNYDDCINASLEVGRRGFELIILNNKKFYPDFNLSLVKDQWKEYFTNGVDTWRDLYLSIKNLGLKYRVSLGSKVFSHISDSSGIDYYYHLL